MNNQTENNVCQNCKQDFTIEPEDFSFYEKIKVPPPTFCPECRLERRLSWLAGPALFKRKCDLCGKDSISMYEPDAPFVVYCHKCWWSDSWDATDYAMDIDFSKPFLEQWRELLHKTPLLGLSVDSITGELSPYTNHTGNSKNCYMTYYSSRNEDVLFGFYINDSKFILNSSMIMNCELCFDDKNGFKNYRTIGLLDMIECIDSMFLKDSVGCNECFASANLIKKKNVFFNVQLTKEEYDKRIQSIDLGSYKVYKEWQEKALEHFKKYPPKPLFTDPASINSKGSYFFQSKNCKSCFEVVCTEDSKFIMLIGVPSVKDSYDYTYWGENTSLSYEAVTVGDGASEVKFSNESGHSVSNIEYSKLSLGSSNHFGCVSLKKKDYSILNKQYSKEEYISLREKIIAHMNESPYIDSQGIPYRYGEFFPAEFSPLSYNNSFSHLFFPKSKDEVLSKGLKWHTLNTKEYPITLDSADLPDNIRDTGDQVLQEVLRCRVCPRGYKITPRELALSRRLSVPLARECPFCRVEDKLKKWVLQMRQIERNCSKCNINFKTHRRSEESPQVLCRDCYRKEIY